MRKLFTIVGIGVLLAALHAGAARAQEPTQNGGQGQDQNGNSGNNGQTTQPTQPAQPITNPNNTNDNGDANTIPAVITPDMTPSLASTMRPGFDLPADRSYVQFQASIFDTVNTNGEYLPSGSGGSAIINTESLLGGVTLEKIGRANELKLQYLGGESFTTNQAIGNSTVQLFGLADKWTTARWSGSFADQTSYLSDPIFSGPGFDPYGLGFAGINLQMAFQPSSQTLLTARTPTLENSAAAEVDYQMSPRSSFTIAGGYFLAHYYGPDLIDTTSTTIQAGYNYQLSQRNTVGGLYRFNVLGSGGSGDSIKDNIFQFSWGRRVAERLRFQIAIGPDVALLSAQGFPSATRVSWTMNSSLAYQTKRTTTSLSYSHMLMDGFGLSLASEVDSLSAGVGRQLGKAWTLSAGVGYSRNGSGGIALGSLVVPGGSFNTTSFNAGISRTLWRASSLFANYTVFYGTASNTTVCTTTTPVCNGNLTNQAVSIGFNWHSKPIPLQ